MQHTSLRGGRIARIAITTAALAVIGGAVAPCVAKAADPPAAFGSVDVNKLQAGYNKVSDIKTRIKQIGDDFTGRLKTQANYDMLNADEQRQLGALLARPNKSDQEKATIGQLENKSSRDAQELAALQQKPAAQLTDADKARLTALTTEHQNGQQALQQISDEYQNDFNAQQEKMSSELTEQIRVAIGQVAKERGLAVVFDSNVAIYCANDITEDVLKRLNK